MYQPTAAVWEITYCCNMRCKHCGSSCGRPLKDELTLDEAYQLCDDLAELGLERLTLSGGEPFMHPHWHRIAKRLHNNHITTNVISNGWMITKDLIDEARHACVENIGVSVDGYKDTHDYVRKPGSWDRLVQSLKTMRKMDMPSAAVTSLNKKNIGELYQIKQMLLSAGVQRWQFQIARPMGKLLEHPELIIAPRDLVPFIEFAIKTAAEGEIIVDLSDDIGCYSPQFIDLWQLSKDGVNREKRTRGPWQGCQAGKCVLGIHANGNIVGCLSIRDERYIEGNIRETPLKTLWTRPEAFAWNRKLSVDQLEGFCAECRHNKTCMAGCSGCKLTFEKKLTQNAYCLYKILMECLQQEVAKIDDWKRLEKEALVMIGQKKYDQARIYLQRASELEPKNMAFPINNQGFPYFQKYWHD